MIGIPSRKAFHALRLGRAFLLTNCITRFLRLTMNAAMSGTPSFGMANRVLKTHVAEGRLMSVSHGLANIRKTHGMTMDFRKRQTEPEKPWHMLVVYTMALLVGAASTLMGVLAVEWVIELFWETIFL